MRTEQFIITGDTAAAAAPSWRERRAEQESLPPWAIGDLRFFFGEYESTIGMKGTHYEQVALLAGASLGALFDADGGAVSLIDSGATKRANRVRRALERMSDRYVVVLGRLYGEQNQTHCVEPALGVLAPIADMTAAAEEAREEMALESGELREAVVGERFEEAHEEQLEGIARAFWQAARHFDRLEEQINAEKSPDRARKMFERAEAWHDVQASAIAKYEAFTAGRERAHLGATLSAMCSADKELSYAAAIRAKLTPARAPAGKKSKAQRATEEAWKAARVVFVAEVKAQAFALRKAASAAYLLAVRGL